MFFCLACDPTMGRTFFDPTLTPLKIAWSTPKPRVSIPVSQDSSSPWQNNFGAATVQIQRALCKTRGYFAALWLDAKQVKKMPVFCGSLPCNSASVSPERIRTNFLPDFG